MISRFIWGGGEGVEKEIKEKSERKCREEKHEKRFRTENVFFLNLTTELTY